MARHGRSGLAVLRRRGGRRPGKGFSGIGGGPQGSPTELDNIRSSELDELVVTDTIPLGEEARGIDKIRQLTISDLLAESIRRVSNEESISALFS